MDRRDFLGSVIGLLVASRVDYRALEINPPIMSEAERIKEFKKLMEGSDSYLRKCKGFYVVDGVQAIKSTPLMRTARSPGCLEFEFDHWEVMTELSISMMGIITPSRAEFSRGRLPTTQSMLRGDTIKGTYRTYEYGIRRPVA